MTSISHRIPTEKRIAHGPFNLPPSKEAFTRHAQASTFVNRRGFVFFWPISGIDLPSLWTAVAGDRPVADKHDDPGHITWGWKDGATRQKDLVLCRRSSAKKRP
ncbi:MAG: hypothetical protein MZV64_23930 [Ignavibacteriales bacterium]|nr:hypothetical protein [Ignavibacteriales bacterium]